MERAIATATTAFAAMNKKLKFPDKAAVRAGDSAQVADTCMAWE